MTSNSTHLVIIDPQNDFCDLPNTYWPRVGSNVTIQPALPVKGAHADMLRIADLIERGGIGLTDISLTLDSHQRIDIAHTTFWMTGNGAAVAPFTQILAKDVREGSYRPRDAKAFDRALRYLDALEAAGRYAHMVWPVHCEIGSWGHNVHADVRAAYNRWEEATLATVNKVVKGTNPWTEHYSAIMAEVPDVDDESTQLNAEFLALLGKADRVIITGEAGSHCVKATTEHIVQNFGASVNKILLVTDCMSPVPGFEAEYEKFLADMRTVGVQLAQANDVIAELVANEKR